jgi:uncharacterized protein YllA (UPF0747 family)
MVPGPTCKQVSHSLFCNNVVCSPRAPDTGATFEEMTSPAGPAHIASYAEAVALAKHTLLQQVQQGWQHNGLVQRMHDHGLLVSTCAVTRTTNASGRSFTESV